MALIQAYKENERGAPLAKAFLLARGKLADPLTEALAAGGAEAVFGEQANFAREAMRAVSNLGPLAASAYATAFPGASSCFALAPKVEIYLFEAGSLALCVKEEGSVFELGWARDERPALAGVIASAQERQELAEGMARLGCALAIACGADANWASRREPRASPESFIGWLPWAQARLNEALKLAPTLMAKVEAEELTALTESGSVSRRSGLRV